MFRRKHAVTNKQEVGMFNHKEAGMGGTGFFRTGRRAVLIAAIMMAVATVGIVGRRLAPWSGASGGTATLCTEASYGGTCQTFTASTIDLGKSGGVSNRTASSAKGLSTSGTIISLYSQTGYNGVCETFTSDDSRLGDNTIGNDSVSSIKLGDTCPVGVTYRAHVRNVGWQAWMNETKMAGTTGQGLPIEALEFLLPAGSSGTLSCTPYVTGLDWQSAVQATAVQTGGTCGTTGQGRAVEALKLNLLKDPGRTVEFRCYLANFGWSAWFRAGDQCGSPDGSHALEALKARVITGSTRYVADLKAVTGSTPGITCPAGYEKNPRDLNEGTTVHNDYVYLCVRYTENKASGFVSNLWVSADITSNPVGPDWGSVCLRDNNAGANLNEGTSSDLVVAACFQNTTDASATPYRNVGFVAYSTAPTSGRLNADCRYLLGPDAASATTNWPSNGDLNQNAGGLVIYLCASQAHP